MCEDWFIATISISPSIIVFLLTRCYYKKKLDRYQYHFKTLIDDMSQYV